MQIECGCKYIDLLNVCGSKTQSLWLLFSLPPFLENALLTPFDASISAHTLPATDSLISVLDIDI